MAGPRPETLRATVPGSAVAQALAGRLGPVRFLDSSGLRLSNHSAANAIPPAALGRKNWLYLGSPEAGPKIAAILSVVETCRRLRIDLRAYLLDLLPRLPDTTIRKVTEFTPNAWCARRG